MDRRRNYFWIYLMSAFMLAGLWGCAGGKETEIEAEIPAQQEETQTETQSDEAGTETEPDTMAQTDVTTEESAVAETEEERGFATSEEAVLSYLAGLRDNDFGRMESAFPAEGNVTDMIGQYACLCGIDQIPGLETESYVQLSEEEVETFYEELIGRIEAMDFSSLELLCFLPMEEFLGSLDNADTYQARLEVIAEYNGGSEMQNELVFIQIGDMKFGLFFDTIKIDDKWYVLQLGGEMPAWLFDVEPEEAYVMPLDEEDEEMMEDLLNYDPDMPSLPETKTAVETEEQIESEGFDTPEEALTAYLEGLRDCDTERMLATFSVESYAENYDMLAYLEYVQAYMYMQQDVPIPAVNDLTKSMITRKREEQLKEDMLQQGRALYVWSCYYKDKEPEQDEAFGWEQLQGSLKLESLEVVDFIAPEIFSEPEITERMKEIKDQKADRYGAEQVQDCVAVFTCGGEKYCLFMEEVRYDGKWYNSAFGGNTAGLVGIYTDDMGTMPFEALEEMIE